MGVCNITSIVYIVFQLLYYTYIHTDTYYCIAFRLSTCYYEKKKKKKAIHNTIQY